MHHTDVAYCYTCRTFRGLCQFVLLHVRVLGDGDWRTLRNGGTDRNAI